MLINNTKYSTISEEQNLNNILYYERLLTEVYRPLRKTDSAVERKKSVEITLGLKIIEVVEQAVIASYKWIKKGENHC
ncbi:hypothetical protein ETSB_1049 [cyanobacterium endosymbiont of Epithemia turgida isolate EtSB Lake Yunoko]|nr:hypothetical protein ETSB_1049 [cyanobacterium endosymbiont of Epithemia turgida isolate EtSB Lake Yunoko]